MLTSKPPYSHEITDCMSPSATVHYLNLTPHVSFFHTRMMAQPFSFVFLLGLFFFQLLLSLLLYLGLQPQQEASKECNMFSNIMFGLLLERLLNMFSFIHVFYWTSSPHHEWTRLRAWLLYLTSLSLTYRGPVIRFSSLRLFYVSFLFSPVFILCSSPR